MDNLRERLDADYFGFYDDEATMDNLKLEALEADAEKQCKLCINFSHSSRRDIIDLCISTYTYIGICIYDW
jgi:hypothetical protein